MKLSPQFYGPSQILEKIGLVACTLDLPTGSKIHLVSQVSNMMGRMGPETVVSAQVPDF